MNSFTVSRATWHRGKGQRGSALLCPNGMKCCLGFLCLALGATEDQINSEAFPNDLDDVELPKEKLGKLHTNAAQLDIGSINDDQYMNDNQREQKLIEEFAKYDWEIIFTD